MDAAERPDMFAHLKLTVEKDKDVGLVMTSVLLVLSLRSTHEFTVMAALFTALLSVLLPAALRPVSFVWYRFSVALGSVMSRVVLTLVFFLVITPVGWIKNVFSGKRMLSERWKKDDHSLFTVRDKLFSAEDISHPF